MSTDVDLQGFNSSSQNHVLGIIRDFHGNLLICRNRNA